MAKIKNIFDGGVRKLGNLVLYKRNGVNVVRVKPAHIKESRTHCHDLEVRLQQHNNGKTTSTKPFIP